VARIPITMRNLRNETHGLNMFSYTFYGPNGNRVDSVSSFFMDYDVDWAGDMRRGTTQRSYIHILYVGNGDYYIEFGFFRTDVEVRVPIRR